MRLYFRILRYLRPHLGVFLLAVGATFAFAGLDAFAYVMLIPFVSVLFGEGSQGALPGTGEGGLPAEPEKFVDRLLDGTVYRVVDLQGDRLEAVQGIILLILVTFALKNLFDFLRAYMVARVEQGVTRDLRNEVYDHLLELDLAFFGRTRMGQIVSRLTHDVEQLRTLLAKELARILSSVFEFMAAIVVMVSISWQLTLAAFVVIPGTMGIWGPLVKKLRRGDRRVLNLAGEVNAHIQETLSGVRLVKSSGAEALERTRFHGLTDDYFRQFVRTERWRALAAPLTEMLAAVGTVVILWYGARLVVVEQTISGSEFVGFLALSLKLYAPVKYVAKFPALVQPGLVGAERVFQFLDAPVEIRSREGAGPFPGLDREIRFEGVSFSYRAGIPVLRDIDLTVPRGTVVALVGRSGAGKTTLVDLLGRFYEVTEGAIRVDGVDLRDIRIEELRKSLGIVSQETVLFHDTVRANIAYGSPNASPDEVEAAARAANADGFISALPDGYDTVVGERGTELSGGQRQRIAIARALLRNPPILIFDEATSALDTESERLVQEAIEHLLEGRTVFVIAHRLSTVQKADQIVVMEEGRIVERGRHGELLSKGGTYRKLHDMQFRDEEPVPPPPTEGGLDRKVDASGAPRGP
ncbi:MAG: ABC transporter ATP-binding protein [Gemmatimonadales bacterium]|nr:MAG: ABC transporter ATP-binding protein [Gemmatimonadales bacterium]